MERLLAFVLGFLWPGFALAASLNGAVLVVPQTFTKGQTSAAYALADAATITVDASQSNVFTVTLGGNRTLGNPTNLVAGEPVTFIVSQPAIGGTYNYTLAYSGDYAWLSGVAPILNTGAGAKTTISCVADTSATLQCAGGAPAPIQLPGYTVSTLPAASEGALAYVTDAVACTFLATLTGGGSTVCPVFYNGTAWVGG
jgi:hypothetical protein